MSDDFNYVMWSIKKPEIENTLNKSRFSKYIVFLIDLDALFLPFNFNI
jgi:hypothetical protein